MKFLTASIFSLQVLASYEINSYAPEFESLKEHYEFIYSSAEAHERFKHHKSHQNSLGFAQAEITKMGELLYEQAEKQLRAPEFEAYLGKLYISMLRIIEYWAPPTRAS